MNKVWLVERKRGFDYGYYEAWTADAIFETREEANSYIIKNNGDDRDRRYREVTLGEGIFTYD